MQPILLEFPGWGIKIHSYGVMMLLACTGALWITVWRASREKLETSSVYGLAGWLFLGGVIGARILFVIQYPETVHSAVDLIRSWQGGNVFYGCIMGGLAGSSALLVATSLSVLADGRRRGAGFGSGYHAGAHRLLPGGMLLRFCLQPTLGGGVPQGRTRLVGTD